MGCAMAKKKLFEKSILGKICLICQPIEPKQMSNICQITQHKNLKAKSYVQKCFCLPMRRELLSYRLHLPQHHHTLTHYFQPALSRQGNLIDFKINND